MNHCCYYFDSPWKVNVLYVVFMSRTHFRANIHSLGPWMSRNAFLETDAISEICVNTVEISTQNASQSFRLRTKWLWVWIPLLSHIALCLNVFAKLQNVTGASRQPVLMDNCSTCLYVLALSVFWMACYQSVPGGVQNMKFCDRERGTSWEENWHEIYAGKCTQKYSKHDKKKWWYTNSLDW